MRSISRICFLLRMISFCRVSTVRSFILFMQLSSFVRLGTEVYHEGDELYTRFNKKLTILS